MEFWSAVFGLFREHKDLREKEGMADVVMQLSDRRETDVAIVNEGLTN